MKKFFTVFLFVLLGLVSCGASPPIVKLCTVDKATELPTKCGRGFVAKDSPYTLTVEHLIDRSQFLAMVSDSEIVVLRGYYVFLEKDIDVAFIRVRTTGPSDMPLCSPLIEAQEDVVIYGQDGPIKGKTILVTETDLRIDALIVPGDSGSPVVSVKRKCIVGAITGWFWRNLPDGSKKYAHATAAPGNVLKWLINKGEEHLNQKEKPDASQDSGPEEIEK